MSGPGSIVEQPSVPLVLRQHRDRVSATEAPSPGKWVYVVNGGGTVAPATTPPDFIPGDPLSPLFLNSWGNVAGSQAVSFRIHPATVVVMRGTIVGGAIPSVVFTLPAAFRPAIIEPVLFPNQDGSSVFTGRVDPSGDVWILAQIT